MTQNIYDNPEFFEGYSRLGRSLEGLDGAGEWPMLRALLPDVSGLAVLDLGCGFGWFCRWAQEQGAARILGIDMSEKMLARAQAASTRAASAQTASLFAAITYLRGDLEHLDLPAAAFGLAYSSLALHYVENLDGLLANVHRALAPGGSLVFSVEHPIYTAPTQPCWTLDADGRKTWPVDAYLIEGPRTTDWLTKGVIKQHRMIGTTLNVLIRRGFTITHVQEWGPTDTQIAARPALADERQRPPFLLVAARR